MKDRISAPLIDRIANIDSKISTIDIRISKKSLDVIDDTKLQIPFASIAIKTGKKYTLK